MSIRQLILQTVGGLSHACCCALCSVKGQDGRSRGFCKVHFYSADSAAKAVELNGEEFMGRELMVNLDTNPPRGSYNNNNNYHTPEGRGQRRGNVPL